MRGDQIRQHRRFPGIDIKISSWGLKLANTNKMMFKTSHKALAILQRHASICLSVSLSNFEKEKIMNPNDVRKENGN